MKILFFVQVFSVWILCSGMKLMRMTMDEKVGFLTTTTTPMQGSMMKSEMKEPSMTTEIYSMMTTPMMDSKMSEVMMDSKMDSKMTAPMMDSKMDTKMTAPMMNSKMDTKMTAPMMDSKMTSPMMDSKMTAPMMDSKMTAAIIESMMQKTMMDSTMDSKMMSSKLTLPETDSKKESIKMMAPMMDSKMSNSKMNMDKQASEVEIVNGEKVIETQMSSEKMMMAECSTPASLAAAKMHCKKKFEMSKLVQEAVDDGTEIFMNSSCSMNATMMGHLTNQPCLYYCILEQLGLLKNTLPDEKLLQQWLRNNTRSHYTTPVCFRATARLRPNITQAQKRSTRMANSCHNQMLTDLPMNIKNKLMMAKNVTDQIIAGMGALLKDKVQMVMSVKEKIIAAGMVIDSAIKNKMHSVGTTMKHDNPMATGTQGKVDGMTTKMPMDSKTEKMPMNGMAGKMPMDSMASEKMPMDGKTEKMPMDGMVGKMTMSVTTDAKMTKDKIQQSSSLQAINMLCDYAEALVMCLEKQDEKCMIFSMNSEM